MKAVFCVPSLTGPTKPFVDAMANSIGPVIAAGWDEGLVEERGCPYISNARATMLRKALDAKASFDAHGALVDELMTMVDHIADASGLSLDPADPSPPIAVRVLAASVTAAGAATSPSRWATPGARPATPSRSTPPGPALPG